MSKFFALILLIILISCSSEEVESAYVDPAIRVYFEKFESEAIARGKDIDLNDLNIGGGIESLEEVNIFGQCIRDGNNPARVILDIEFWNNADEYDKEFLVFHELGHCALNRTHLDEEGSDGKCISIMNSGSTSCRQNYRSETREDYLDELFDY